MVPSRASDFTGNIERFTGFAPLYDRVRPSPPAVLATLLPRLAGVDRPELVVDLGSGTGLSTRYWAEHAQSVIGIEPTADMRAEAAMRTHAANVVFREGFSHHTGLPDGCAQIVCCMQALHWMEPEPTFREAARILGRGGVFAACDYDWPPATGAWEADAAFEACSKICRRLEKEHGLTDKLREWDKPGHLGRMRASGCFRHGREIIVHHVESGNAKRLIGVLLSQGYVAGLLKSGYAEDELGLTEFKAVAHRVLGTTERPWIWSARLRVGIV